MIIGDGYLAGAGVYDGGTVSVGGVPPSFYGYSYRATRPTLKGIAVTGMLSQPRQELWGSVTITPYRESLAAILLSDEE